MLFFLTVCYMGISPGWRDHKDHESLYKHDREEALQCEVCLQLWKQLDQVIDCTGHNTDTATIHLNHNKQEWTEDVEMRRGTNHSDRNCTAELLIGCVATQTNSIQRDSWW